MSPGTRCAPGRTKKTCGGLPGSCSHWILESDPPRIPHFEIAPLTPEQAGGLLKAVEGDRLEALYSVAVAIGLRQGEALGLRWEDLDLDKGTLSVRASLQRVEGEFRLVEPKTKRSRRTIHLPQVAISALWKHRAKQETERAFAGDRWTEWGLVFTTIVGTPIDQRNLLRHFSRVKKAAKLPARFRFHDLRHTCASLLIAQGVHPRQIMETLGHSQISLTMNTYGHIYSGMQKEVAAKMDAILKPCTEESTEVEVSRKVN